MKIATCPSCGAAVDFRSSVSLYKVCPFCSSTLVREGYEIKNLGRMAQLMDDPTLIQIGTEGQYEGVHFVVIGRLQLKYEGGVWNEWYLLYDDMRTGWLSDASGEYTLSSAIETKDPVPPFESLVPDSLVRLDKRELIVTDLARAHCIGGEGELPFAFGSGYDVSVADLRGDGYFVTFDYSDDPPRVYLGQAVPFKILNFNNLRTSLEGTGAASPTIQATAFQCPECAAPLKVHSKRIEHIGCSSCGKLIGLENKTFKLVQDFNQAFKISPWIPLGSRGTFDNIEWEAIGFMRRGTRDEESGTLWTWTEYLLFNPSAGFAWLVEYEGHWSFARTLSNPPRAARGEYRVTYEKTPYQLFNSSTAEVLYVVGEFYWKVRVGDQILVEDYIAPPLILSREVNEREASWSQGVYLDPRAITTAFSLDTPPLKQHGIYANQPNPYRDRLRADVKIFLCLLIVATLVQLFFSIALGPKPLASPILLPPQTPESTTSFSTQTFTLTRPFRGLKLEYIWPSLQNGAPQELLTLIHKDTGRSWPVILSSPADKSLVQENSNTDAPLNVSNIFLKDLPRGTYYFVGEYAAHAHNTPIVHLGSLVLKTRATSWSNYVLLILFLSSFPLYQLFRRAKFESLRWKESNVNSPYSQDDDDD